MKPWMSKVLAVLEVIAVNLGIVPLATLAIYRLFPSFETWQTGVLGFPFPVFVYVVMAVVSLLAILLRRRKLAGYGLVFTNLNYQLDIAAVCFLPVAISNFPLGMGVDHKSWGGAVILALIQVALLFVLGWILRKKPSPASLGLTAAVLLCLPSASSAAGAPLGKALVLFLTYALFVGFGEEIIYRGYMQSRLNEVFAKPYRFLGVSFGWGAIISAILFGCTHVGILRWILGISTEVTLAWGFWTIFSGLVFGFVREKSQGILAPALLHGLPQAIATVAMLYL